MTTIVIDRTPDAVRMQERLNGDVEITAWHGTVYSPSGRVREEAGEAVIAVIPKSKRMLVSGFLKEFKL